MKYELSPSILAADFNRLESRLRSRGGRNQMASF